MRLYVGNLPADTQKRHLEQLFGKYGNMLDVSVKRTVSGAPFAFIEFQDDRDAQEAIRGRDGYNYTGYRLRVEVPFASRSGGSGRGGRGGRGRGGAPRRGEYRVIVNGLPPSGSWQDLKDHMRDAGECVYADVFRDGTGVVEFTRREDCEYALRHFKDSKFRSHEGEVSRITVRLSDEMRRSASPPYHYGRGRDDSRGDRYDDSGRNDDYRRDDGRRSSYGDNDVRYGGRRRSASPFNASVSRGRSRSRSRSLRR